AHFGAVFAVLLGGIEAGNASRSEGTARDYRHYLGAGLFSGLASAGLGELLDSGGGSGSGSGGGASLEGLGGKRSMHSAAEMGTGAGAGAGAGAGTGGSTGPSLVRRLRGVGRHSLMFTACGAYAFLADSFEHGEALPWARP
ncbi:hypothetical protein B484DRAFT_408514, partial [Ochromonadaceae sp. CCMP2298]